MDIRQKGFTAIEATIIVVVVLAVGFGGWWVWHANQKDETKATNKNVTASAQKKSTAAAAQTGTGGETKYLAITEWGVKFALRSDNADAYYDSVSASSLQSRSLRVHSLDSEADCKNNSQSIAAIFRVPKDAEDDSLPGKTYQQTQDGQVIGDYFYFIGGAQYMCAQDPENQVTAQAARNSFVTAGPTIQKL